MIEEYFDAFADKDIAKLRALFSTGVSLQDPVVGKVEGIEAVLAIYQEMFKQNEFDLRLKRKYNHGHESYATEFSLLVTDTNENQSWIEGVDLIEVKNDKIISIRAYLDTSGNKTD